MAYFRTEKDLPLFLNGPHNDHTWIESCNLLSNKVELKGVKKTVKLENQWKEEGKQEICG